MTDRQKYHIDDPLERFVALTATKFDYMTEALIDRTMCSEKCPCYVGDNRNPFNDLDENILNSYGRTKYDTGAASFVPGDSELIPLVWSSDRANSYQTFEECYEAEFATAVTHEYGMPQEAVQWIQSQSEAVYPQMVEHFWILRRDAWAYVEAFEERHQCSGMCRTSLFHYS